MEGRINPPVSLGRKERRNPDHIEIDGTVSPVRYQRDET